MHAEAVAGAGCGDDVADVLRLVAAGRLQDGELTAALRRVERAARCAWVSGLPSGLQGIREKNCSFHHQLRRIGKKILLRKLFSSTFRGDRGNPVI